MPITASAKKALRRDRRRALINQRIRDRLKKTLKQARTKPAPKLLNQAASLLDRAAKKRVIPPSKAGRLKSKLAKLAQKTKSETAA